LSSSEENETTATATVTAVTETYDRKEYLHALL